MKYAQNITKSTNRSAYTAVSPDEVECLIVWPKGSAGERNERMLLHTLITFANEHGYGRLSQMATELEDIWSHPKKVEEYTKMKKAHLIALEEPKPYTQYNYIR
jgi:hypothetical protein